MIPLQVSALNDPALPWQVRVIEETPSTSDWIKQNAADCPVGTVLFAETQTAGRGRRDNRWHSSPGKDLIFSMLLRPAAPLELWPRITTLAALAICRAIEAELPLQPRIKWPNDVYLADQKCVGLLAETSTSRSGPFLVLGIGINVNTLDFPPGLQATSLLRQLGKTAPTELDRNALASRLMFELHQAFLKIDSSFSEALAEVRQRSWLLHRQIRAQTPQGEVFGRVLDIDEEGRLVLQLADGSTLSLSSADHVRAVC